jgi:membrane protein CcdC involved in cytochrome C biogenesis
MILSIIIHLYFAVNIFIAGMDYEENTQGRKVNKRDIVIAIVFILFASLLFILVNTWDILVAIYKRTWLNWVIATIRAWNKHIRKGEDTELYGHQLKAFRENIMINKMPPFMRNIWFKIIDTNLQKQRDDLAKKGEVSDF